MKISIIGAGKVGSAIAAASLYSFNADEIVLIDIIKNLAEGEALDLNHAAVGLKKKTKFAGGDDFNLAKESDFVVITAGRGRKVGETRESLFDFNSKIVEEVCQKLKPLCGNATLVVVTNPSTQITELCRKHFSKVIGMENQLDTSRAKFFVSKETGKPPSRVKSSVAGGHGENMSVEFREKLTLEQKQKINEKVKNAGPEIIALKGATWWGIAAHVVEEIKAEMKATKQPQTPVF